MCGFGTPRHPAAAADLLITSHKDTTARDLARAIYDGVNDRPDSADDDPAIAPLQSFVAARLYFDELLRIVVPMTKWWHEPRTQAELTHYRTPDSPDDVDGPEKLTEVVDDVADLLKRWSTAANKAPTANQRSAFERFIALCALVFLARENIPSAVAEIAPDGTTPTMTATEVKEVTDEAVENLKQSTRSQISQAVFDVLKTMNLEPKSDPMVFQISLNRRATLAIDRSVPTVKADAARRLFGVDCSKINWAIIDSGIDSGHPAFDREQFKGTYDFTHYRRIVSLGNEKPAVRKKNLDAHPEGSRRQPARGRRREARRDRGQSRQGPAGQVGPGQGVRRTQRAPAADQRTRNPCRGHHRGSQT